MPPSPPDALPWWENLRGRVLRGLEAWRRRTGLLAGRALTEVYEECLGALWLELGGSETPEADWSAALRRVLYREWEAPARRACRPLGASLAARAPLGSEAERAGVWREAEPFLDHAPLEWRLDPSAARLGLTRQELRVRLTCLANLLTDREFLPDLRRRAARILARAAREGPTLQVGREARRALRLMSLVELPPDLEEARAGLRSIPAARTPVGDRGSRGSASG